MDTEQKRKRIELVVKIVAAIGIGLFVGPFIMLAIKGLLGLIAAAVITFVAINFTPYVASLVANWRLKAIKYEASRNPIETLQNEYKARHDALISFKRSIESFSAEVMGFKDKLSGFKKTYPEESARFDEQYRTMHTLLESRKDKYKSANQNLNLFSSEITKASAIWDMAQAAAAMNKLAGADEQAFIAKIQVETALDSVQKSMSIAFSDLEVALLDEPTQKQLSVEQEKKNKDRQQIAQ